MAGKSVGTLSMFINADATGLMKTFNQVDRQLARWSSSWTKPGAKLALGFLGMSSALSAIAAEVRHVMANVERIPGIPAQTITSVVELRKGLEGVANIIHRVTAGGIALGAQIGQAVGAGAAALMGHTDTSGLSRQDTPDELATAKDPEFHAKILAAREKLAEATKASTIAAMDEAKQIIALRAEAQQYEMNAASNSKNTVERLEAQRDAQGKLAQANTKMAALNAELAASEELVRKAMTGVYVATVSKTEAIQGLENRTQAIFHESARTSADPNDPEAIKKRIELNKELADKQEKLGKLYKEQGQFGRQVGETIAGSFEQAIVAGDSLADTLKNIGKALMQVVFQRTVTGPMADMLVGKDGRGGLLKSVLGGFFADGGRPPVGMPSVVGERGPELFVPDVAGRIIPNHKLGGGDGGAVTVNQTYNIGAGVTAQELRPILAMQKQDILGTIVDAKRRRGAMGRAL